MPAKSKAQQRFMGMVHAYQKGELKNASSTVKKVAKSMDKSDAKKYASTKHKGKPEKVKQESVNEARGAASNKGAAVYINTFEKLLKKQMGSKFSKSSPSEKDIQRVLGLMRKRYGELESVNEGTKVYSMDVDDMVDVLSAWEKGRGGYTDGNIFMGKDLHGKKPEPFYNSFTKTQVSGGLKDALKALTKMWKKLDVKPSTTTKIFKAYHKLPDSKKKFSNPSFWEKFLEKNGISVVAESVNEAKPKSYKFKFKCMECGKSFIKSLKKSLEVKCPKCKSVDIELENVNEATNYYKSKRKSDDLFYKKVGNKWYKSLANKKGKVGWYVVKFPQDLDKKDMNKINKTKLPNVLRESLLEKISKEEWAQYPKYARKLKPYLQKLFKVPIRVKVIKQANHNPWIEVRVARFGKDIIPNDFRVKAAKAIGASGVRDWDNVNYGNIKVNSISLKTDDWRKLLGNKVKESVNEGKKRYYQQDRVGSAKYTISYHDGKKKHKDGSDFFDIKIFRNKKDLAKFVNTLHKSGYVYGFNESVNEASLGNKMKITKTQLREMIREELNEAAPKMRGRPGEKELKSILRQLERLKHIDISGRHTSKLKSAIDSTKKSVAKIEKIIRMSSTL